MGKKSKKSGKGNPKSEGMIESGSGDTSSSDKPTSGDDSSKIAKFEEGFNDFSVTNMSAMEDIFVVIWWLLDNPDFKKSYRKGKLKE